MDHFAAAGDCPVAPHQHHHAWPATGGLCMVDHTHQPFHDVGSRSSHLYASSPSETARCRSVLESLLTPIAGQQAPALATTLLKEFGSVKAMLAARQSHLRRTIPGAESTVLHIVDMARAFEHCLRLNVQPRGQAVSVEATIEFLKFRIGFAPTEMFYALYFDRAGQLIHDGVVAEGSLEAVNPSPRIIIQVALDIGAAGIVIAHNHPSGDPTPSRSDISLTRDMMTSFRALGLHIHDHFIVCRHDVTSMRGKGLI
jgi:DNA repair protein RadC